MTWNWSETTPHAIHMANPCTERAGSEQLKFELCPNINSNSWDLHGFTKKIFLSQKKKTLCGWKFLGLWFIGHGFANQFAHKTFWEETEQCPQKINIHIDGYDSSVMDLHVSSPTKLGKKRNNGPKNKYTYRWVYPFFLSQKKKHHVDWSSWVYDSSVMELHVSSPTKHFGKKRNNAPQKKYTYRYIHMYIYYIIINM